MSDESLHSIRCHDQGKLLACGSRTGDITLLELSNFLSTLQPNEKQNITTVSTEKKTKKLINFLTVCCDTLQVLERETHREKVLEGRRREMKLKAKQQSAAAGGGGGGGGG